LAGGLIGGAVGGIAAAINGGSFLEGFADGDKNSKRMVVCLTMAEGKTVFSPCF